MKTNPAGVALMHRFESCRLEAYPDPKTGGEPWTIGWGHTAGVKPGQTCTKEQADAWYDEDNDFAEDVINKNVKIELEQHEFDALVSIVFNVGKGREDVPGRPGRDGIIWLRSGKNSTLLRKLNAGDRTGAADEFLKWVSPGSSVERGLRRRRVAERALFFGEDWEQALKNHIDAGG